MEGLVAMTATVLADCEQECTDNKKCAGVVMDKNAVCYVATAHTLQTCRLGDFSDRGGTVYVQLGREHNCGKYMLF